MSARLGGRSHCILRLFGRIGSGHIFADAQLHFIRILGDDGPYHFADNAQNNALRGRVDFGMARRAWPIIVGRGAIAA